MHILQKINKQQQQMPHKNKPTNRKDKIFQPLWDTQSTQYYMETQLYKDKSNYLMSPFCFPSQKSLQNKTF